MTLPLVVVPVLYQRIGHVNLLSPRHFIAGGAVIIANALGWVFIYGWRSRGFRGLKEIIEPLPSRNPRKRVMMELAFTVVNFFSVVLIYRAIVDSQYGALDGSLVEKVCIPALVFFSGMCLFVAVRPEAMDDPKWIEIRDVVGGLLIVVTLTGGMFM